MHFPAFSQESNKQPGIPGACSPSAKNNSPVPLDGSGSLGQTYNFTDCGLNYAVASQKIGQRFTPAGVAQPATFTIAGLPATANILQAYVWCGTSGTGIPITLSVTNPFGGTQSFTMTNIGSGPDKCWGYAGTHTYRADITPIVTGNGNYQLSGLPTGSPDDVDGATMMIIYSDASANFQGTIVIYDGCVAINGGVTTQTLSGFNVPCSAANESAFMMVADLQGLGSLIDMNGGTPFSITEDWWNYIPQNTSVSVGQTSSNFTVNSSGDCYNLAVAGLYFQTNCGGTLSLTSSSTPSACGQNNGTATVNPVGNGPFTYSWNTTPVQNTATATNLPVGTYTVVVSGQGACGLTTDSAVVVVNGTGALAVTTSSTTPTCFGGSDGTATVTVSTGTPPYTYQWSPNVGTGSTVTGLSAGTYTVTVTDDSGCALIQNITVNNPVQGPLGANAALTASPICAGSSTTLYALGSGGNGGPYSFSWSGGAGNNDTVNVTPATTTTYTVTVSDLCNTPVATATVTVTVNPLPTISFTADTLSGCFPVCVNFTNNTIPASATCLWDFDDNSTSTDCNPVNKCFFPGTYDISLSVSDVNGCSNTSTVPAMINVWPLPNAAFDITPDTTNLLNPTISVIDGATGSDSCMWIISGVNETFTLPAGQGFTHTFEDTGIYVITQIVTNQFGCSDTLSQVAVISEYTTFYAPNTFTPNGDGLNDLFYCYGVGINTFELRIFDRWGNNIFTTDNINTGWDGKANGGSRIAQQDTYVFIVKFTDLSNKKYKYIGHVNLIK
jgi:gliding motility-associated-like protein